MGGPIGMNFPFVAAFEAANTAAGTAIVTANAFSGGAAVSATAATLGPISFGNYLPQFAGALASNQAGGLMVGGVFGGVGTMVGAFSSVMQTATSSL